MQNRNFVVSLNFDKPISSASFNDLVKESFISLGYKLITSNEEEFVFEKGSKTFTYIGLVNWNYLFRRVQVSISRTNNRASLKYSFSWLTNISVLVRAAMPEIKILQNKFAAKTLKVERFR